MLDSIHAPFVTFSFIAVCFLQIILRFWGWCLNLFRAKVVMLRLQFLIGEGLFRHLVPFNSLVQAC